MYFIRTLARVFKGRRSGLRGLPGLAVAAVTVAGLAVAAVPASAATPPSQRQTVASPAPAPTKPAPTKPGARAATDCFLPGVPPFSVDNTTVLTGSTVTLTANWNCDIGPTPLFFEIFDTTTGALAGSTGGGTSFSLPVSQGTAGTHRYVGYIEFGFSSSPPSSANMRGNTKPIYVTWEAPPNNFAVSLNGPSGVLTGQPGTFTATTNQDVGPTPYFIEIFDDSTGALLASCSSGTSCSATYQPSSTGFSNLVAFVSAFTSSLPPANVQASSNVLPSISGSPGNIE